MSHSKKSQFANIYLWIFLIAAVCFLFFQLALDSENHEIMHWNWRGITITVTLVVIGITAKIIMDDSENQLIRALAIIPEALTVAATIGFAIEIPHISKILQEGVEGWLTKKIADIDIPQEAFSDSQGPDWRYIVVRDDKLISHAGTSRIGINSDGEGRDSLLSRVSISGFRTCEWNNSTKKMTTYKADDYPWKSQMVTRIADKDLVVGFVYQFERHVERDTLQIQLRKIESKNKILSQEKNDDINKVRDIIGYGRLNKFIYDESGKRILKMSGEYRQLAPNSVSGTIIFSRDSRSQIDLTTCQTNP